MRLAPVMLALLLALSPAAVAVQASAPATSASAVSPTSSVEQTDTFHQTVTENTTAVLTLGSEPKRTAFDSPSASLGSSLSAERSEVQTQLDTRSLDQQLQAASSSEQKQQLLTQFRYQIENRIISLKARERQAASEFSNGSISATEYVRTLGRIDAEAEEVRHAIRVLDKRVGSVSNFGMPGIDRTLNGKLATLEGPVRHRVSQLSQSRAAPTRIYAETTDTGVVLSMIVDGTYVREAVRLDARTPSAANSISLREAQNQIYQQYPWALNHTNGPTTIEQYRVANIYSVTMHHQHGNFTAYLDSGTEKVFKETQFKYLTRQQSLPPGPGVQNTTSTALGSENVTLTVNRSYAGGPLRVELTNETDAPLNGQVTVGGHSIGKTGSDGVLWALSPAKQFRVSATYEGTTINQTVTPIEPDYNSSED